MAITQITHFGKYDLLDRINVGGMAEVWRARLRGVEGFEKILAVKRILPNIAEDAEFIAMFIDEAKISVQLTHANIAQTHDLGKIDDNYFIAMEYVSGRDLRAIFDRARKRKQHVPVPLSCYCVARVCDALDYAHHKRDAQGKELHIVHRDISPQNVIVSYEGEVKLIDFGIAKAASKATQTQAGILKGKFAYMSPEQIQGQPLDGRSDIFALGTVLYELLTGTRLFPGDSDFSTLENVRRMKILPPSTYNNRVPRELETIVMKALAREVDQRYRRAAEIGADLQRFLALQETVFGPNDLSSYMRSTFAEELSAEKSRAAERAAAIAAPAAPPPPAIRAVTPPRAEVAKPPPPATPLPWGTPSETTAATMPALPRRVSLPPTPLGSPLLDAPLVPAAAPAPPPLRAATPPAAAQRRMAPWLVSVIAAVAGAAVVMGCAALFLGLRDTKGSLVVAPTPADAQVSIDHGRPAPGMANVQLGSGPHVVDVTAPGFAPYHEVVQIRTGEQSLVQANLESSRKP